MNRFLLNVLIKQMTKLQGPTLQQLLQKPAAPTLQIVKIVNYCVIKTGFDLNLSDAKLNLLFNLILAGYDILYLI